MRKKLIAGLTAAGLVAGAGITTAIAVPGLAIAQEQDGPETPQAPGSQHQPGRLFADLVEDGVLDDEEVAAVQEVLQELRDAARAEHEDTAARPGRRHPVRAGFALHELLEDGVVDAGELAALPDDHPIFDEDGPFAPYLDDDQLTSEELEEMKAAREAAMEERHAERMAAVEEALQSLVDAGTLTAGQVDAVIEALETAHAERPHPLRRGMRAGWQIAGMLEDGVIDATELAQLPAGHPLADPEGPAADYLEDGQLTQDELAELRWKLRPPQAATEGQDT